MHYSNFELNFDDRIDKHRRLLFPKIVEKCGKAGISQNLRKFYTKRSFLANPKCYRQFLYFKIISMTENIVSKEIDLMLYIVHP